MGENRRLAAVVKLAQGMAAAHTPRESWRAAALGACQALEGNFAALSVWERERGRLRVLVNVGELAPGEEEQELVRARAVLEGLGAVVHGYRSPSWDFSGETLRLLAQHGLRYSSNLMDDLRPYRHAIGELVELPVQWILDDAAHWWFSNADWANTIAPTSHVREIWEEEFLGIRRLGGTCVFTMHPQIIGRPSRLAFLDAFVGFLRSHDDVRLRTCAEIAEGVA